MPKILNRIVALVLVNSLAIDSSAMPAIKALPVSITSKESVCNITNGTPPFPSQAMSIPAVFIRAAVDLLGKKNKPRQSVARQVEGAVIPSLNIEKAFIANLDRLEPYIARHITSGIIKELFARRWPIRTSEIRAIFQNAVGGKEISELDAKDTAKAIDDTLSNLGLRPQVWITRMLTIPGLTMFAYGLAFAWHIYSKTPPTLPLWPMLAMLLIDQTIKGLSNRYLPLHSLTTLGDTKEEGIHLANQFHRRTEGEIFLGLALAAGWAMIALTDGQLIIPNWPGLTSFAMGAVLSNTLEAWYLGGATNVVIFNSKQRTTAWNLADFVIKAMFIAFPLLSLIWRHSESKESTGPHPGLISKFGCLYFKSYWFESNGRVYELLGVRQYLTFWKRIIGRTGMIPPPSGHKRADLLAFAEDTKSMEVTHLLKLTALAFFVHPYGICGQVFIGVVALAFVLYPIMVTRYHRAVVDRLITKLDNRTKAAA